jgi:hypothetical protein
LTNSLWRAYRESNSPEPWWPGAARVKRLQKLMLILLLTAGALLIHGYHPFAEDAEIYLPGVERILQPGLFASDARFFEPYTHLSLFAPMIAASVRITYLKLDTVLFLWHLLSVFLFLLACRNLSEEFFASEKARWASVILLAVLLTLPVAGTALYVMDQYVNPRNFAAFAGVFAITAILQKKYLFAGFWVCFALALHPLMGSFALFLSVLLIMGEEIEATHLVTACLLPASFLGASSKRYQEAARLHAFHYILDWRWYEWLGIIAPIAILWGFAVLAQKRKMPQLHRMCRALTIYGSACFAGALLISVPGNYGPLARLQPLRGLHLLYILLFLIIGGFLGEYILRKHLWRWLILFMFMPLALGMFLAQRSLFPASAHIEWPGAEPRNPWARGFRWVHDHTETDAKFALDPNYLNIQQEDTNGFRAIAQRSKLADAGKDSGAISMFPAMADQWWQQVQAQKDWQHFSRSDFHRLQTSYGVNWVILENHASPGLDCPYRNETIVVCRTP